MKPKILITLFTIIFALLVLTVFTADRLHNISMYSKSEKLSYENRRRMLDVAQALDPGNAEFYYSEYEMINAYLESDKYEGYAHDLRKKELTQLKKAINLRPAWPLYHMVYALTTARFVDKPNIITKGIILSEMGKSVELRPFDKTYKDLYQKYLKKYGK
jgi:hypothetical protein